MMTSTGTLTCKPTGSSLVEIDQDLRDHDTFYTEIRHPGWRIGVNIVRGGSFQFMLWFERVDPEFAIPSDSLVMIWYPNATGWMMHSPPTPGPRGTSSYAIGQALRTDLVTLTYDSPRLMVSIAVLLNTQSPNQVIQGREAALYKSLNSLITSGSTSDVLFRVFSRRRATGGAHEPRNLYVNSSILAQETPSETFISLIRRNDFADSDETKILADAASYDYDSDSDLEDGEEKDQTAITSGAERVTQRSSDTDVTVRRRITIIDGAFVTWAALVFYLYTGHISFAPLESLGPQERADFIERYLKDSPGYPTPCSPKSMFRLAEKYQFTALEDLALKAIMSNITPKNAVQEYFSTITMRYSRVQAAQRAYLLEELRNSDIKDALRLQMKQVTDNQTSMAHALDLLVDLALSK